jgi:uncharacterized repeat protein (TIGR01451 family)
MSLIGQLSIVQLWLAGLVKQFMRLRCLSILVVGLLAMFAAPIVQAHNTITVTTSTPSVVRGGIATYTIISDAIGTSTDVTGISISDALPPGFTYLSSTVTLLNTKSFRTAVVNPAVGATTPAWGTFSNLAPATAPTTAFAGKFQIVVNALVGPTALCGSSVVTQTAVGHPAITLLTNTSYVTVTGLPLPNLVVTKVATTPNVAPGGTAGYTLQVTNTAGDGCPATGVTVSDALPAGFTYAATGAVALAGGATRPTTTTPAAGATAPVWGSFTIPAGGSVTIPFTATVGAAQAAGTYSNSASTATTAAGATITNFNGATSTADDVAVFVPTFPILTKSFSPTTVYVGQTAKIVFKVDNSAATTINRTGLTFRDNLTTGLTIASPPVPTSVGCSTAPTFTATNGATGFRATNFSIAAGTICTMTLTVNVAAAGTRNNGSANISNIAGGIVNSVTTQNLTVINPLAPTIAKSFSPNPVATTVPTLLTFTLVNPNSVPINAVTFADTFPTAPVPGMTVATPLTTTNTCGGTLVNNLNGTLVAGNAGIRLNGGTMAANATCNITVQVLTIAVGSYANTTGTVATTNNAVTSTGLTASSTLVVQPAVPPFIAKTFSPAAVGTGDISTLTFTINNPNNATIGNINGVAFSDTYPNLNLVNAPTPNVVNNCGGTITGGTAGGNGIALTGGSIAVGGSCTISINVVSAIAGGYLNTSGTVSSTTPLVGTGNAASATLTVLPKPTISKAFATPTIAINGTTTLTLTVTNPSTTLALSNVAFSDNFPTNLLVATPSALASDCGGTATAAAGVVSLTGGSIAANSSCTITADVTSSVAGSYSNTTTGVSSTETGGAGTVSNTAVLKVLTTPTISKAFLPTAIPTGGASTLTLTISNPNGLALSGLALTDTFPANLVVAPTPNITSINLAGGTVAANTSCTLSVDVTSSIAGSYSNTADGVASTQTGAAGAVSNTVVLNVVDTPTIVKSFLPISVAAGSPSTMTLVITNPNAIALTGLLFADNFPTDLVVAATPNVTSTCGGTFTATAADVSVDLAAGTVAANTTCTIKVDVTSSIAGSYDNTTDGVASTESGTAGVVSNRATLTVTALGVPINGFVYSDANHNIQKDGTEAGTPLTLFAKLVPLAGGPALQAVPVTAVTGAYQFPTVAAGQYSIVIDDNATLTDITPTIPAGWIGTEMPNFTRANVLVAATELQNLNFGLFNGSKLSGTVFADTGIGGGTANNGVKDGAELGIAGVTVKASSGATIYDSAISDGAGSYTLWIPAAATSPILISETNLSNYISTGGSVGNTAGAYTRTTDSSSFTFAAGSTYSNVNFGDVPVNRFASNGLQSGLPSNVLFYAHQFDAGSGGTIVFSSTSAPAWPTILYRDLNCNGVIDATDTVLTSATVVASGQICVIDKVTIPAGTALGLQANTTVQAVFTYTNASPVLTNTLSVIDSTTVGAVSAGLVLTKAVDKVTAQGGDTVTYTLSYQNNSNASIASIVINDATPAYTSFLSASCVPPLPAAITVCTVTSAPAIGAVGSIKWTLTGTLSPASTGQVRYSVKVDN